MLRGLLRLSGPAVAALLVVAAPASARTGPTLRLTLDPNQSTLIDLLPVGASIGDRFAIDAPVRDAAGTVVGTFRAEQTTVAIESGAQTVQTQGVFTLADGTITFAGAARSPLTATGLTVGDPFERAVTGGTGRYAGAGGTLVSRKRADGVYEQTLRLVLPDGAPTTRSIPGLEGPSEQRIDLDPAGFGPGDLIAIRGSIADPPGGAIAGTQTVIAPEAGDLSVLTALTFTLPEGQLGVVGPGLIASDGATLVNGRTFDRAVVGGTGGFVGRGGTQAVTRDPDGSYRNVLQLWAPRGHVLRLRLTGTNTAHATLPVAGGTGQFDVTEDRLVSRQGRRVGRVLATRTTVVAGGAATSVAALRTFNLPGGTIVAGGAGASTVSPVIGGTGRFAGMRGTLTVTPGRHGTSIDALRLQRIGSGSSMNVTPERR